MKKLNSNGDFVELKLHNHFVVFTLINGLIEVQDYLGYEVCTSEICDRIEARRQYRNYIDQGYVVNRLFVTE